MKLFKLTVVKIMNKIPNSFTQIAMVVLMAISFSACEKDSADILKASLVGCEEHVVSACSQDPTKTNLRIKNNSDFDFCNVVINLDDGLVNCGALRKGETTCYRAFKTVYNYGYVQLLIDGREFNLIPTDFTGETPLGVGKFAYLLDIPDIKAEYVSITILVE